MSGHRPRPAPTRSSRSCAQQITRVDRELLAALNRRLEIVRTLHDHKQANGCRCATPAARRRCWRCCAANAGPLSADGVRDVLRARARADPAGAPRCARRIVCLPGDGIGPEVMGEALQALAALPLELEVAEYAFGGAAIDAYGDPLPPSTLEACREADAVLLGAVGGPAWEGGAAAPRGRADRAAQGARRLREPAPGRRRGRRSA